MKAYRGIVTLTLLMLLSSLLVTILLFDDEILAFYSATLSQRQIYVEQISQLQQESDTEKERFCQSLSPMSEEKVYTKFFNRPSYGDFIQHSVFCQHHFLIADPPPTHGENEHAFEKFIQQQNIPLFAERLQTAPTMPPDTEPHLYWFPATQNEWQIQGDFFAIVIAEGDLHITGNGKITGAVITAGKLSYEPSVQITYRKSVVTTMRQTYSQWQFLEKSWNDFYLDPVP